MHLNRSLLTGAAVLLLAVCACSLTGQASTPIIQTVIVTAVPTATEVPTATGVPAATDVPTEASVPTATAVPPPPANTPKTAAVPIPVVSNSNVEGNFNGLIGKVHFSRGYLMRMEAYTPDGSQDGDGIQRVTFTISDANGTVYQHSEQTAGYCIFGGGEPDCNPWPQQNGQVVWGAGGPPVQPGTYSVQIEVEPTSANGDASQFGEWIFTITVG